MKHSYLTKYIAYYRVSTQEQGRSGLGLDAQKVAVENHARSRSAEIIAEFTEVESGRNAERPQLRQARALAIRSKAVLLIAKLDRLSRSVQFISTLMSDSRLEIEACDLPAANRMTLHIMAAVAEGEAEAISQRTKAALASAKARGKKLGFANKERGVCPEEARLSGLLGRQLAADRYSEWVGQIIEDLRLSGLTFDAIADELTRRRLPMRRKPEVDDEVVWKRGRVYQVYRRYSFIGPRAYGRVLLPAPGPSSSG